MLFLQHLISSIQFRLIFHRKLVTMKFQKISRLVFVLTIISLPVVAQKTVVNRDLQTSANAGTIRAKDINKTETFTFSDIHMCFDQYPSVKIPQKPLYQPPVPPPSLN